jgi:hypothetical protein
MMFFLKKKKKKKIWEISSRVILFKILSAISCLLFYFIGSMCFDELCLHVVENISLTYAKFSCSLFMLDSCFPHVMILCIIQGSPKVHLFPL